MFPHGWIPVMRCFGRTAAEVMCLLRASCEAVCEVGLPRFW